MPSKNQIYALGCEDALAFVCEAVWGFAEMDQDGCFVWLNRAFCEILNAPADLILGTHFESWTHPDDIEIDTQQALKVKTGELPGYTLSKRYIQRGSTPARQMIIWGLLSVQGKWKDGSFAGYRVQFRVYDTAGLNTNPQLNLKHLLSVATGALKWGIENWKTLLTMVIVAMSLMLGGSSRLLDTLQKAIDTKRSVDSALDSLSPGASQQQPLQP